MDSLVRSIGNGIYVVDCGKAREARAFAEQIGRVLEVWTDPGGPGRHVAVLEAGRGTSLFEARILDDEEVASAVFRAAATSPPDSVLRARLPDVDREAKLAIGEGYDAKFQGL